MRVHGAWSEFLNKFPDRTNMTFEETDEDWTGRTSLLVLLSRRGREGNTQLMIAQCTAMIGMGCKDTNRES